MVRKSIFLIGMLILALLLIASTGFPGSVISGITQSTQPPSSSPLVIVTQNQTLGAILTNSKGMTLYIFTKDASGVSNCNDDCATNWPPLTAWQGVSPLGSSDVRGSLSTITRADGSTQVTINGMPLYYFSQDAQPGDAMGYGIFAAWYIVDGSGRPVLQKGGIIEATPMQASPNGGMIE